MALMDINTSGISTEVGSMICTSGEREVVVDKEACTPLLSEANITCRGHFPNIPVIILPGGNSSRPPYCPTTSGSVIALLAVVKRKAYHPGTAKVDAGIAHS